ncbi:hypothetical protein VTK73DRAFT_9625 [Phialemonium thermophilum]|uniref:Serine hydrolase domain-containing protein n=1 Tax=Phialemonium thermophilum TaxID=223376 RepID=A0ABR3XKW1_9PEZI
MAPLKVLCLHGAQLSSEARPYLGKFEKKYGFVLDFVNGPVRTEPEASIANFWDQPCYRFFHWAPSPVPFTIEQVEAAYDYLYGVLRDRGPFDGVIGFSQGSVMAVALLLHHARLHPDEPPLFRFAVLFSIPHLPDEDANGTPLVWGRINVPSLHVCGEGDEMWFESSKRTFERNCVEGSAEMIIHKEGHVVPKDPATVERVIEGIGRLLKRAGVSQTE